MRIGLFGGSFNPLHNAHLRIAQEAQTTCQLGKIIFIPAADPPHKLLEGDVTFENRSQMVSMAICDIPGFEISNMEAERGGKSYSIDTIRAFKDIYSEDELFFIIGGDSFLDIGTWHCYGEIFSSCNVIVVERPGCHISSPLQALPDKVKKDFSLNAVSDSLFHRSGTTVTFVEGSPQEISSTEIRRIAATDADLTQYVPRNVAAYISQQRIYSKCQ